MNQNPKERSSLDTARSGALMLCVSLLLLTGCSSGSGDTANNNGTTSNSPPTVNAGDDFTIGDNQSFDLSGSATDSDGSVTSFSWAQIGGPAVTIENANSSGATFNPGDLAADAVYRFRLTATDDDGASSSDDVSISVDDNSSALRVALGPLSGAAVAIFTIGRNSPPVFEGTTSQSGIVVIPHADLTTDTTLWLVEAVGGVDTDPDQDGVTNGTTIANASTLRSYFTREQLTRPEQSLSMLSDIAWFFARSQEKTITADDLLLRLGDVARVLLDGDLNGDGLIDQGDLTVFDSVRDVDSTSFIYASLLQPIAGFDTLSLVDAYHQGFEDIRADMISSLFGSRLSSVPARDSRFDSVSVRLAVFGNGSVTSSDPRLGYDANSTTASLDSVVPFERSTGRVTLFADPEPGSEVLLWRGCGEVAIDQRSCTVTLEEDRMVEVLFKYSTTEIVDNVFDLSAAFTEIADDGRVALRIGHEDRGLVSRVESIGPGDFIVGSASGGFLRRVESKVQVSDFRFEFETSFASLEDVLVEGTIYYRQQLTTEDIVPIPESAQVQRSSGQTAADSKAEYSPSNPLESVDGFEPIADGIRLVAVPGDPSSKFRLVFGAENTTAEAQAGLTGGVTETVVIRDPDGREVTITGEATFTVSVEFAASFSRIVRLDYFMIAPEITAEESIRVSFENEWESQDEAKLKIGTYRSPTPIVVALGALPVYLTPRIDFFVGLDGKVSGRLSGGSAFAQSFRAGVVYNRNAGVSPIIDADASYDPIDPIIEAEASVSPFIEPQVGVDIYGINGPAIPIKGYIKFAGTFVADTGSTDFWRRSFCIQGIDLGAWVGLRAGFRWNVEENQSLGLDTILGEVIADKLKVEFSLYEQEWELNSGVFGGSCPNEAPALSVSGPDINTTVRVDLPELVTRTYEIENLGDSELEWEVAYREDSVTSLSQSSGTLAARGIDVVTAQIDTATLSRGRYENILEFRNLDAGILVSDADSGNTSRHINLTVVASSLPPALSINATLLSPTVASLEWLYDLGLPETDAVEGFVIESRSASNNNGAWTRVAYVPSQDVRTFVVADLTTATAYEFRVFAVGDDVQSEPLTAFLNVPAIEPTGDCEAFFTGLLAGDRQETRWISEIFVVDLASEYVGAGLYRLNAQAFPNAVATTFDGIAISAGTRVTIYSESDFEGEVLYDRVGPAVVNNSLFQFSEPYASFINGPWKPELEAIFPQSVREWSETNMHDWSQGSLILECGY